jgi:hypothetical protein
MLDYPGVEFILVGARSDPQKAYGAELAPQENAQGIPDIFRELHLRKKRHPVKPLLEGK